MHELSIAAAILELVEKEAALRESARFVTVGVRLGELSGVDADSLSFAWEAIVKDTSRENLRLKIDLIPWVNRCEQCAHEFRVLEYQTQCPACRELRTRLLSGNELDIAYIEVDEPEVAQV